ncbi:DUF6157 family protein [Luteolibacter sp. LG18]|uniref:DUF6157 family protein n=1 Tax=Luteolibacter sp. LG18 TaxID=2819286 RepID=UPI002B2FBC71|nr:hypothetical protein llg_09160 [Luteolibacter sp. LG18]
MSYTNTFVRIAADCPESHAIEPPARGKTVPVHTIQLGLLRDAPYHYTHEALVVESELRRDPEEKETRAEIVKRVRSKPIPCLRCSSLAKRYGWGFHFDAEGKIAVVPAGSPEYLALEKRQDLQQVPAMRNKKA